LTADLRWVPIKDIRAGQELVATDEHPTLGLGKGKGHREMRTAVVERVLRTKALSTYRIIFDDGRSVICSANHRWLSKKTQKQGEWRSISGASRATDDRSALKPGDMIRAVTTVWDETELSDAWFGGIIDGEGSLDFKNRTGVDLAVSQCAGEVLDRMVSHCNEREYKYCVVSDDGPRRTKFGAQAVHAISISNIPDLFRLIGRSRPVRFIGRSWWNGKRLPHGGWRTITSIELIGNKNQIDLQTSTGTFIAEGFVYWQRVQRILNW
jgi:hypothetical protein